MKRFRTTARTVGIALALAGIAAAVPAAQAADKAGTANPKFVKLDKDRDGYLSREEVAVIPGYQKPFTEADDNRDGKLSPDEFPKAESNYDRARTATYAKDTVITTKVKAAMLRSPALKSLDVSVVTYNGQVLLSGFVRNADQRDRAIEVASTIEGVTEVRNGLVLR